MPKFSDLELAPSRAESPLLVKNIIFAWCVDPCYSRCLPPRPHKPEAWVFCNQYASPFPKKWYDLLFTPCTIPQRSGILWTLKSPHQHVLKFNFVSTTQCFLEIKKDFNRVMNPCQHIPHSSLVALCVSIQMCNIMEHGWSYCHNRGRSSVYRCKFTGRRFHYWTTPLSWGMENEHLVFLWCISCLNFLGKAGTPLVNCTSFPWKGSPQ